jgi:hypothetical protein
VAALERVRRGVDDVLEALAVDLAEAGPTAS